MKNIAIGDNDDVISVLSTETDKLSKLAGCQYRVLSMFAKANGVLAVKMIFACGKHEEVDAEIGQSKKTEGVTP